MKETLSCGNWPANSIADTRDARNYLRDNGYIDADFVMVTHNNSARILECLMHNSPFSFGRWLLHQGILHSIIIDNDLEKDAAYIYATKKGIPIIRDVEGLHVIPTDSIVKITEITGVW